jgi:hypothetical protein
VFFASAASDVDPDNIAGQRTAEPVVVEDAAPQTTREHAEEQPTEATVAETAEEYPAPERTRASTPSRDGDAARTPPPSRVAEEEDKAPTSPPAEEGRVPTPPRVGATTPEDSPGLGQGPVMPATTAGGSKEGEETRAASDDEVEEIQGRPQDGRQHVYVWRQRGDHFIGHEELAETEEAARVERAAKRLVDEVKVSGLLHCSKFICVVSGFNIYAYCRAQ